MPKRPCELTDAKHHSDDVVHVWHGEETPLVLCGYHTVSVSLTEAARRVKQLRAAS